MEISVLDIPRKFDFVNTLTGTTSVVDLGSFGIMGCRIVGIAVRVHSAGIGTNGQISVKAYASWPWDSEPQTVFAESTQAASVPLTATLNGTTGALETTEASYFASPALRITVEAVQPSGGAVALNATLTISLLLYSQS